MFHKLNRQITLYTIQYKQGRCQIKMNVFTGQMSIALFYRNIEYDKKYQKGLVPSKTKEYSYKYHHTEKGRLARKTAKNKHDRNLGFNLAYPNILDEKFHYHHMNTNDVVAIPVDLHQLYMGNYHRENLLVIINQIYKEVII